MTPSIAVCRFCAQRSGRRRRQYPPAVTRYPFRVFELLFLECIEQLGFDIRPFLGEVQPCLPLHVAGHWRSQTRLPGGGGDVHLGFLEGFEKLFLTHWGQFHELPGYIHVIVNLQYNDRW